MIPHLALTPRLRMAGVGRNTAAAAALGAALMLAGCVTTMQTPDGSAGITAGAVSYHFAAASGCAGALNQLQAEIDSDVSTGNLNRSVYRRMVADLKPVQAACAAGRNGEAESRLAAVKARYGYR